LLRFPMVKYANSKRRRNTARLASLVAVLVMIPSIILFINLLREQVFVSKTKEFVNEVINYPGAEIVRFDQDYKTKAIEIYLIGRPVPQSQIQQWIEEIRQVPNLEDVVLEIYQGSDQSSEMAARLTSE